MSKIANLQLRYQQGVPEINVMVPKGTSLREMATIQEKLFADPTIFDGKLKPIFGRCLPCLSGIRIFFGELPSNPAELELHEMVGNLALEVQALSSKIQALETVSVRRVETPDAGVITQNLQF